MGYVTGVECSNVSATAESRDPLTVRKSYSAKYVVETSDQNTGPTQILDYFQQTPTLPWAGRPLSLLGNPDNLAICKTIKVNDRERGSLTIWTVTADFEPDDEKEENDKENGKKSTDPLEWHDEIDLSYQALNVAIEDAVYLGASNGAVSERLPIGSIGPLRDSTGTTFMFRDSDVIYIQIVRITRKQKLILGSTPDVHKWDAYTNTINIADTLIKKSAYGFEFKIAKHCGLLMPVTGSFQITNGKTHWNTTLEVHVHPRSWIRNIMDEGKRRIVGLGLPDGRGGTYSASNIPPGHDSTGTPIPGAILTTEITDEEGKPLTMPSLLDGKGMPLADTKKPVFLKYRVQSEKDWSAIEW